RRGDAARERLPGALVEDARALGPLVQAPLLPLGQLGDARPVEIGRRPRAHAVILSLAKEELAPKRGSEGLRELERVGLRGVAAVDGGDRAVDDQRAELVGRGSARV